MGKLPNKELGKLLRCVEKHSALIIPPRVGYDSGVHKINENEYLVVSTDPCLGVPREWFGWLLIHYAASDVALFGARPKFCTITLLGPPKTRAKTFLNVMKQVCNTAEQLQISVATGHTGTYEGISTLVGVCTAYGTISKDKLITPGGARPNDYIICTKEIGLETIVNFCIAKRALAEKLFTVLRTNELKEKVNMQTCLQEATILSETGGINAMHDTTEGGLVAALNEIGDSSNLGFRVQLEKLPILAEVHVLKKHFGLSLREVLSMSSTGTLLAAVTPNYKDIVLQSLRDHGVKGSCIGTFTERKKRILLQNQTEKPFPKTADDPYSRLMFGDSF